MPEVAVEVRQCPLRFGTRNGGGAEEEAEERRKQLTCQVGKQKNDPIGGVSRVDWHEIEFIIETIGTKIS